MGLYLMSMRLTGMHLVGVDLMGVYLIGVDLIGMLCSLTYNFSRLCVHNLPLRPCANGLGKIIAALSIIRKGESCGIGKVDRLVMESLPLTFPPQSPLRRR
jgi:hypothetical protein